ncbi:MAG: hypothetical protein IJX78_00700 [Bacilli bacterium]|nr:hypothetical protein [Bacilli bacterium]
MKKAFCVIGIVILIFGSILCLVIGSTGLGWFGTWFNNKTTYVNKKIDDATNYETIKKVEDTCRSMVSSYKTDLATYNQYKDSDNSEKQSWAEQAKMRANKTANTYNEYILKNSFVWKGNVPSDIEMNLQVIY